MAHGTVNITLTDAVDAQRIARALRNADLPVQVTFTGSITDDNGVSRRVADAPVTTWSNTRRIRVRSDQYGVLVGLHFGEFNLHRE
jgi:hypothetical protein